MFARSREDIYRKSRARQSCDILLRLAASKEGFEPADAPKQPPPASLQVRIAFGADVNDDNAVKPAADVAGISDMGAAAERAVRPMHKATALRQGLLRASRKICHIFSWIRPNRCCSVSPIWLFQQ